MRTPLFFWGSPVQLFWGLSKENLHRPIHLWLLLVISSGVAYIAPIAYIGYNKKMNNTQKISPGMSVQAISRLALELGCEVIIGNSPGDISLKHPAISSSLVLSGDQQNPGNKFALWAKPLIKNNSEVSTMLNPESQQGRIARTLQKLSLHGTPVVLGDIVAEFENIFTKKQVADGVSHLIRKGYLERVEPGKYKATEMLNQGLGTYKSNEYTPVQESQEEPVKIRRPGMEVDLVKLEGFIERLERAVEKLETTAQKLQDHKEIQNALDIMEKALARRNQR
ncbi:MAG: hypothetical protein R6X11_04665 [Desulfonatronovibrio sp.]